VETELILFLVLSLRQEAEAPDAALKVVGQSTEEMVVQVVLVEVPVVLVHLVQALLVKETTVDILQAAMAVLLVAAVQEQLVKTV
jgi:hypothetical protein